jgi:hypothetical protein
MAKILVPALMLLVFWPGSASQAEPSGPEVDPAIRVLAERLLQAPGRALPSDDPDPAAPIATDRVFGFDDVMAYRAEHFLQAVDLVLAENPPPPAAVDRARWERETEGRLTLLLGYYPLVATRPEDVRLLVARMASGVEPPVLRTFLLRKCAPGLEARSSLGRYLQAVLAHDVEFDEQLSAMIKNPTEQAPVQEAALEALAARLSAAYGDLIASDPLVQQYVRKGNALPGIRQVKEAQGVVPLSRRTELLLAQRGKMTARLAAMLRDVAEDPARSPALRQRAQALSDAMVQDYPIPDPEPAVPAAP